MLTHLSVNCQLHLTGLTKKAQWQLDLKKKEERKKKNMIFITKYVPGIVNYCYNLVNSIPPSPITSPTKKEDEPWRMT